MRISIKMILRALLEDEIESKEQFEMNEPVFEELCGICDEIEKGAVYTKAHGFDIEIDPLTQDTIISLRFPCALTASSATERKIKIV